MEKKKTYFYLEDEKCTVKQKFGKCLIPLKSALFCLECFTIHTQTQCPNCLSLNSVRLIELFLSEPDPTDEMIKKSIEKKFMKIE